MKLRFKFHTLGFCDRRQLSLPPHIQWIFSNPMKTNTQHWFIAEVELSSLDVGYSIEQARSQIAPYFTGCSISVLATQDQKSNDHDWECSLHA